MNVLYCLYNNQKRESKMKVGDLVRYREKYSRIAAGVGLVMRTTAMYAYVKWAKIPSTEPFIANKEHLELVNESR